MFARYYLELPLPAEDVERAVLADPGAWVPGIARQASARGEALLAEVGFGDGLRIGKQVSLEFGAPIRMPSKTVLPIQWRAAAGESLFPALDADLEVAPLGSHATQLSMSARYVPPMGALGRAIDKALLHRVAEATIKDFLDRVAETLMTLTATSEAETPGRR